MAITLTSGFNLKSQEPIDSRLILSKSEMVSIKKTTMPSRYFCLCSDDNCFYIYDKNMEPSTETGLYKKISTGGSTIIEVTQNEYDQLSDEDKMQPYLFYITDKE